MNKENQNMGRLLPVINFAGTFFYIDAQAEEFRQVNAPGNTISMKEVGTTLNAPSEFAFDRNTKNIYQEIIDPENIPAHVTIVMIPSLPQLELDVLGRRFRQQHETPVKKRPRQKSHRI